MEKKLVWNGLWNEKFQYEMDMEWKKFRSMEYGKIVFHSIACPDRTSVRLRQVDNYKSL